MPNQPLLSPEFSRVAGLLKIKPYPDATVDIETWDLTAEFNAIIAAQSTADAAQSTADDALAAAGGIVYPSQYTLFPNQFITHAGGFGGANYNTGVWLNVYWLMNGLNSDANIVLPLAAGTYNITMLWTRGSASGDLRLTVDGTNLGAAIGYNATNLNDSFTWTTGALTAGEHTFNIKTVSKQGASSGYQIVASLFTVGIQ